MLKKRQNRLLTRAARYRLPMFTGATVRESVVVFSASFVSRLVFFGGRPIVGIPSGVGLFAIRFPHFSVFRLADCPPDRVPNEFRTLALSRRGEPVQGR
jgi:hypothetical protein